MLIEAARRLSASFPSLTVAIGGTGRERGPSAPHRRAARSAGASPRRVLDADLPDLVGAADVFAVPCRSRWLGLEQEGFGIVFMEAAAAGVPQVAGQRGAAEAVEDGVTGLVVARPGDPAAVAGALRELLSDDERRRAMGARARQRAEHPRRLRTRT